MPPSAVCTGVAVVGAPWWGAGCGVFVPGAEPETSGPLTVGGGLSVTSPGPVLLPPVAFDAPPASLKPPILLSSAPYVDWVPVGGACRVPLWTGDGGQFLSPGHPARLGSADRTRRKQTRAQ